jgi:hypothetical protein
MIYTLIRRFRYPLMYGVGCLLGTAACELLLWRDRHRTPAAGGHIVSPIPAYGVNEVLQRQPFHIAAADQAAAKAAEQTQLSLEYMLRRYGHLHGGRSDVN